jgi:dinuclear metal center YbgI/SA1388 family protein
MIERDALVTWVDNFLDVKEYKDYAPNGLQVEGTKTIYKIIGGVSASLEMIERAIEHDADLLLVHHGIFWKGDNPVITGVQKKKIELLIKNNISLVAYHLPIDGNFELGNARGLADYFKLTELEQFSEYAGKSIGIGGKLQIDRMEFLQRVRKLNPNSYVFDHAESFKKLAIVTGAAPGEFRAAIREGYDVFLTGEPSEWVYHMAKEEKKTFIGAGHHATETFGIKKLCSHIDQIYDVKVEFIEIKNPV